MRDRDIERFGGDIKRLVAMKMSRLTVDPLRFQVGKRSVSVNNFNDVDGSCNRVDIY
jgi:hypothetical protein